MYTISIVLTNSLNSLNDTITLASSRDEQIKSVSRDIFKKGKQNDSLVCAASSYSPKYKQQDILLPQFEMYLVNTVIAEITNHYLLSPLELFSLHLYMGRRQIVRLLQLTSFGKWLTICMLQVFSISIWLLQLTTFGQWLTICMLQVFTILFVCLFLFICLFVRSVGEDRWHC